MAVLNAQYKQPGSAYSQGLKDLIDAMLKTDPTERPDIHKASCHGLSFLSMLNTRTGSRNDRSCIALTGVTFR